MSFAGTMYGKCGPATALGVAIDWQEGLPRIVAAELAGHATPVRAIASAYRSGNPIDLYRTAPEGSVHSSLYPPAGLRTVVLRRLPGGLLYATLLDDRCRVTPHNLSRLRNEVTYLVQHGGNLPDSARLARRLRVLHRIPILDEWAEPITRAAVTLSAEPSEPFSQKTNQHKLIRRLRSYGHLVAWAVNKGSLWAEAITRLLREGVIQAPEQLWADSEGGSA